MNTSIFKEKKRFENISECVNEAIETGNHQAFVNYFLEGKKTKFMKEIFVDEYSRLINYDGGILRDCEIMKSNFWRDSDFFKNNDNFIESDKEKEELGSKNKAYYGKENKYKWFSGTGIPDKDTLVQIGVYLGWGCEEVNRLLRLSGKRQLYPLDIVDAIGMYYLEYYKDNKEIEPQEKLNIVKKEINERVKQLGDKMINVDTKPIGYNDVKDVNDEIEQLKRICNIVEGSSDTLVITDYVKKELEAAICCKSFSIFFENVKDIVANKQYGYLRRTLQYIDETESYKKNLFYPGYIFSSNLIEKEISGMIEAGQENKIWAFEDDISLRSRDDKLKILNGIWKLKNVTYVFEKEEFPSDSVFMINNLIKGRTKNPSNVNEHTEDDPYFITNDEVLILMKFAIAAGKEDKIGEYLIRSGHREENLNDMISHAGENDFVWEKTDSLIIYCLCYRDKLIEKWAEKYAVESRPYFCKNAKEMFPMIQLLMNISKEIQSDRRYEQREKDYYKGQISCLLYPIEL